MATKKHWDWDFLEGDMTTLFSIAFAGIFLAFIVAAVVGHLLLLREFVRPFTAEAANRSPLPSPSLQPGF
jgi:hypothetical protein